MDGETSPFRARRNARQDGKRCHGGKVLALRKILTPGDNGEQQRQKREQIRSGGEFRTSDNSSGEADDGQAKGERVDDDRHLGRQTHQPRNKNRQDIEQSCHWRIGLHDVGIERLAVEHAFAHGDQPGNIRSERREEMKGEGQDDQRYCGKRRACAARRGQYRSRNRNCGITHTATSLPRDPKADALRRCKCRGAGVYPTERVRCDSVAEHGDSHVQG